MALYKRLKKPFQQEQPADECWLLNSVYHALCLHVHCFHTVSNFRLYRRHVLLLGPLLCHSSTALCVLKQHQFVTQWLWNIRCICFIICSIYLCTMFKIVCEIKFSQCHTLFIICSVNFTESKSLNLIILYFSCDWLNLKKKKCWNLLSPFCLWLVKVVLVAPVGSC